MQIVIPASCPPRNSPFDKDSRNRHGSPPLGFSSDPSPSVVCPQPSIRSLAGYDSPVGVRLTPKALFHLVFSRSDRRDRPWRHVVCGQGRARASRGGIARKSETEVDHHLVRVQAEGERIDHDVIHGYPDLVCREWHSGPPEYPDGKRCDLRDSGTIRLEVASRSRPDADTETRLDTDTRLGRRDRDCLHATAPSTLLHRPRHRAHLEGHWEPPRHRVYRHRRDRRG